MNILDQRKNKRASLTKQKSCPACKHSLENGDDIIQCDACTKWFHLKCAKVTKNQAEVLRNKGEIQWKCVTCTKSVTPVSTDLAEIAKQIAYIASKMPQLDDLNEKIDAMQTTVETLEESTQHLSDQVDGHEVRVTDTEKQVTILQNSSTTTSTELARLKSAVKKLNDDKVKNEAIILNVKVNNVEAAETFMEQILNFLKLDFPRKSYSLRLVKNRKSTTEGAPSLHDTGHTIFVTFMQHQDKMQLMYSKSKLRTSDDLKHLRIYDVIGPETSEILEYAKILKQHNYQAVFTLGDKIYAKLDDKTNILIRSKNQVDQIIRKAVSHSSNHN